MTTGDLAKFRGIQYRPINKIVFFTFVGNLLLLLVLGAKHVESPFIEFGQIATLAYFAYFLLAVPANSLLEFSLNNFYLSGKRTIYHLYDSVSNSVFVAAREYAQLLVNTTPSLMPVERLKSMPIPGVTCPICQDKGKTVWVIPGENCPECGHQCRKKHVYGISNIISIRALRAAKKIFTFAIIMFSAPLLLGLTYFVLTNEFNWTLGSFNVAYCDAPRPWGLYFQDSASPQMEALVELHNNIMFYLLIILFSVGWILGVIVLRYGKSVITNKFVSHGTMVELIWTVTPGLILIFIAFTSFKLLYLMDEVSDVNMTFYVEGHQWYWTYQYPDFIGNDDDFIGFDSYLVPEADLEDGALRMLDVDERVILPEVTHARFLVSSGDVIHSYACPSLGIKADAYPGRLNQASSLINRLGTFYGQCSEICGILHSSMPIVIQCITLEKFLLYLWEK